MKKGTKRILKTAAAVTGAAAAGYFAADLLQNIFVKPYPDLPADIYDDSGSHKVHELLLYLHRPDLREKDGIILDDAYICEALRYAKQYIDGRFDCQDFRMQSLLRLQYSFGEQLQSVSPEGARMLLDTFLNAKYWMREPGEDSICYWSENHQLLYAVAEYLAGQYWPDATFSNDDVLGSEHMQRGKKRIAHWVEHRILYGYSEFNSANYYKFNVGPAANFIQFAAKEDAALVQQVRMALDLLFFDIAANKFQDSFIAPTGRAYVDNMVGETGDGIRPLTNYAWQRNDEYATSSDHMLLNFYCMMEATDAQGKPLYEIPPALLAIGDDDTPRVIKFSHGMNTSELPEKGYVGHSDNQIMMQLGMESFTNPEVIANTVSYLRKHNMFTNQFVNFFKLINLEALQKPGRLAEVSRRFKPMPNGIAIQRANQYIYRTKNYQLSNVQRYHPGGFGAQQMLNLLNFGGKSVVFTAHPAREESEKTVRAYPGYWAGFGRSPHAVQHENVLLLLYHIPKLPGFLELYRVPQFTHTYLPQAYLDEVHICGRYAFARKGDAFLALIGGSDLEYLPYSEASAKAFKNQLNDYPEQRFDLLQRGNRQFWIYELSGAQTECFADFMERIKSNPAQYELQDSGADRLRYESGGNSYFTSYKGDLAVNDIAQPLEHDRFDSAWCKAKREQSVLDFESKGNKLHIDFYGGIREYTKH